MNPVDSSFEALLGYLKEARGFDFTGYKRTSLARRVQRRMQEVAIGSYEEYQDFLALHPDEFVALFNTVLINVTSFFRDEQAWGHLEAEVLPRLLARKPDGPLRLWSAGCASGEEAYSLAMVLAELLGPEQFRRRVKIYATDVDEEALSQARQASYEQPQLRCVRPERLATYFEWDRGGQSLWYDVTMVPLFEPDGGPLGVSVLFADITRHQHLQGELEQANRQIEAAYEELQSTNEELETTNEELQSTVEELETTNEELQSTNEELETMNEELQSMNDELQLRNEELRERTAEVGKLNLFMESVFTGLRAGVAVVDRDLRVQVWNARAEGLWGVRRDEAVGQHLLNLDFGLPVDRLRPAVRALLAGGPGDHHQAVLTAVNRRGRVVQIQVTTTALRGDRDDVDGVIIMMDEQGVDGPDGPDGPDGDDEHVTSSDA